MQKIYPCLWFDNQAEEAAKYYASLFPNSKIGKTSLYSGDASEVSGQKVGSVMTLDFEIGGLKILGLNGGPIFKFTPAMSLFIWCDTEKEIDELWKKLSVGGEVRMGLDKYPWAQKYGWTTDKFGVEWQMMLASQKQKIMPAFLFVDKLFGQGEEAIGFYTSVFKNSKIEFMSCDDEHKTVAHCIFTLNGQSFVLMEGPGKHGFTFNNSFSLIVNCETQAEIDEYWEKLSDGGTIEECGWLKDRYGVSWQIVPAMMNEWMTGNPKKADNVMKAVLQMKKLDLHQLKQAYEQ